VEFADTEKPLRQARLLRQYKFVCTCVACENNWPTEFNVEPCDMPLYRFLRGEYQRSHSLTPQAAWEKVHLYAKLITKHLRKYPHNQPSLEFIQLQLKMVCSLIISSNTSAKIKSPN